MAALKHDGVNFIGEKFGKLTILSLAKDINKRPYRYYYLCKCECGNEKNILWENLVRKNPTVSCGCWVRDKNSGYKPNRRLTSKERTLNSVYTRYKLGAERRNLIFNLTKKELADFIDKNCFYCGNTPSQISKNKEKEVDYLYTGIDRVDSSKGYSVDNCVPCCTICNFMKNTLKEDIFISQVEKIYFNLKNKK